MTFIDDILHMQSVYDLAKTFLETMESVVPQYTVVDIEEWAEEAVELAKLGPQLAQSPPDSSLTFSQLGSPVVAQGIRIHEWVLGNLTALTVVPKKAPQSIARIYKLEECARLELRSCVVSALVRTFMLHASVPTKSAREFVAPKAGLLATVTAVSSFG